MLIFLSEWLLKRLQVNPQHQGVIVGGGVPAELFLETVATLGRVPMGVWIPSMSQ
ncbi:hypothetical protein ACXPVS_26210 [Pseudomonas sp. Ma2-10]